MDYFDEEKKEDLDKKLFEASYKKQIKASKRIFKIMGFIFTTLVSISTTLITILILGCNKSERSIVYSSLLKLKHKLL